MALDDLHKQVSDLTDENERLRELAHQTEKVTGAFEESQSRFRAIFEASRMGNKIIDSSLKILQVNAALVRLLGYSSKEEIIGTTILDYSPQEQHVEWRYLQKQLWKDAADSFSLETTLIRKDGSTIWCQVTSILFRDQGETLGYTIIEDITEQYKLRQLKEEFIAIASHELKTPVTSIKLTLQLINRILDGDENDKGQLRLLTEGAEKSTTKLINLIEDLLSSTKVTQGQLALNRTEFPVKDVVENCSNYITLEGSHKLKVEGDAATNIYADQQKIEQVLINLLNNAIKYAPEDLQITIRVESSPKGIKISVVDQGKGIAPKHISKLFDRYFRVDEMKRKSSGLGLGLYISAEIIKRHGGQIGVNSDPGRGSSFWFTLPSRDTAPTDAY